MTDLSGLRAGLRLLRRELLGPARGWLEWFRRGLCVCGRRNFSVAALGGERLRLRGGERVRFRGAGDRDLL